MGLQKLFLQIWVAENYFCGFRLGYELGLKMEFGGSSRVQSNLGRTLMQNMTTSEITDLTS